MVPDGKMVPGLFSGPDQAQHLNKPGTFYPPQHLNKPGTFYPHFDEEGISNPFPRRDVHVYQHSGD